MLYIFGGLPATGKTTLARQLAGALKAVYLRVDTIEQALRGSGVSVTGPEGYVVAYQVAQDNLALGLPVVADTVNPLQITRSAWRKVARQSGVQFFEIEIICSDRVEHQARVTARATDIDGLQLPTWDDILKREYEPWDTDHIVIDTAGKTPVECFSDLSSALAQRGAIQPHPRE